MAGERREGGRLLADNRIGAAGAAALAEGLKHTLLLGTEWISALDILNPGEERFKLLLSD